MRTIIVKKIRGSARTVTVKKNIIASLFLKGTSIIIGFLMIRVCLDYLDETRFGIWLILTSFFAWFKFFDIGLGNGLRNKLAVALAENNFNLAKKYVSTTYALILIIMVVLGLFFIIINRHLNWNKILNTNEILNYELLILTNIVFGAFFIQFILQLIKNILFADQKNALSNLFNPLSNFLILITIYILTKTTQGSLIYLGTIFSVFPIVILLIATIILFSGTYNKIKPSIKHIDFDYSKDLMSLGFKFFLIQISGLIIYQTSNIIIAQYFGPKDVTIYNIAYKLFLSINLVFAIIVTPFWSAYTEAWVKNDIPWIKKSTKKLIKLWGMLLIFGISMLLLSPYIYQVWVGETIKIPFNLSLFLFIYFILRSFGAIFVMFINGIGKLRVQLMGSFIGALIFIPLNYVLIEKFEYGIISLVISMIIANFYGIFISPIQYYKIINNRAKGVWNR